MPQIAEANPAVDAFLAKHQNIQALPENTTRVLRMSRSADCDTSQLVKLIEQDAALSVRLIKAVNSAYYALQSKMTRVDRAVAFMGLKAVKEVVVSSCLATLCKDVTFGQYTVRDLWDHSVGVAILCREFAVHTKTIDPEDAFLAGMLHDVGLLLAAQSEVEKSKLLFNAACAGKFHFMDIEQQVFKFDHCQLGERLSENWKFPEYVTNVIRWHHYPDQAPVEFQSVCALVFIADTLCSKASVGCPLTCATQEVTEQVFEVARLSSESAVAVAERLPVLLRLHLS